MEEAERLAHEIVVLDAGSVIAEGNADQLKERLGGDLLEARVSNSADLEHAASLLARLAQAPPRIDADQQRVSVPTSGGTTFLVAAGRRFEEEYIPLDDLGIRRPSLDDVFLALTGSKADRGESDGGTRVADGSEASG
jgi:ABC-2 type transport system ATP-binding protein